ncbi:hypothetical protein GCM10009789_85430 [Kribbella sancticallisti]|uniref:Uncharacterized protein n=1 Tax=Kribbella sancticallisti TaxID=460087 RepID=A0ABN2EUQ4_9ACTN
MTVATTRGLGGRDGVSAGGRRDGVCVGRAWDGVCVGRRDGESAGGRWDGVAVGGAWDGVAVGGYVGDGATVGVRRLFDTSEAGRVEPPVEAVTTEIVAPGDDELDEVLPRSVGHTH